MLKITLYVTCYCEISYVSLLKVFIKTKKCCTSFGNLAWFVYLFEFKFEIGYVEVPCTPAGQMNGVFCGI